MFGMFRHGGCVGLTKLTQDCPGYGLLLARLMSELVPEGTYTTIGLSVDAQAMVHKDTSNDYESLSHLVPVAVPGKGGRLWTELRAGDRVEGRLQVVQHKGESIAGQLREITRPVTFRPSALHATEPWPSSQRRVMLVAYTVGCWQKLDVEQRCTLERLGFSLPLGQAKGGGGLGGGDLFSRACDVKAVASHGCEVEALHGCVVETSHACEVNSVASHGCEVEALRGCVVETSHACEVNSVASRGCEVEALHGCVVETSHACEVNSVASRGCEVAALHRCVVETSHACEVNSVASRGCEVAALHSCVVETSHACGVEVVESEGCAVEAVDKFDGVSGYAAVVDEVVAKLSSPEAEGHPSGGPYEADEATRGQRAVESLGSDVWLMLENRDGVVLQRSMSSTGWYHEWVVEGEGDAAISGEQHLQGDLERSAPFLGGEANQLSPEDTQDADADDVDDDGGQRDELVHGL